MLTGQLENRNNNRGHCSGPGSEYDTTSDENSNISDRPFTKLTTAGAGIKIDSLGVDYAKSCKVTDRRSKQSRKHASELKIYNDKKYQSPYYNYSVYINVYIT